MKKRISRRYFVIFAQLIAFGLSLLIEINRASAQDGVLGTPNSYGLKQLTPEQWQLLRRQGPRWDDPDDIDKLLQRLQLPPRSGGGSYWGPPTVIQVPANPHPFVKDNGPVQEATNTGQTGQAVRKVFVMSNPPEAPKPLSVARMFDPAFANYSQACDLTVPGVLNERITQFKNCDDNADIEDRLVCRKAAAAYDKACLLDASTFPDVQAVLTSARRRAMEDVTGILYLSSSGDVGAHILCSGAVIAKNLVITARHCLFANADDQKRDSTLSDGSEFGASRLLFRTYAVPDRVIGITEVVFPRALGENHNADFDSIANDWAVLRLDTNLTMATHIEIGPPIQYATLVFMGYELMARYGETQEALPSDQSVIDSASWTRYFRADAAATCTVVDVPANGCFVHACQTEGGSSGAPVFSVEDTDTIRLVGIQSRAMSEGGARECTDPRRYSKRLNAAVGFTQEVFDELRATLQ